MKNIIVLSDGTGNGASATNKTNVWKLYRALKLHDDRQIAIYNDGVGSKKSLWNRLLGGAFGLGLKRNVRELYIYLCRNYQEGDRIYLFGFSRGAFTVRILAGLIGEAGLYTKQCDDLELEEIARGNYSRYRDKYSRGWLTRALRFIFRRGDSVEYTVKPEIHFIGVWDTVDAYVFPLDELAAIWDLLIYPIRFEDNNLGGKVKRACHALSVDDERQTFHPKLWNEKGVEAGRIQQVWFPGVHADVGGGYARTSLSLVPLDWMITQVQGDDVDSGLVFIDDVRQQYKSQSDWNGPQHDSRSGPGVYYRYKPRNITDLCNDSRKNVFIERPKIHRSVFERISANVFPYAPTGLPEVYEVAATEGGGKQYESADQAAARVRSMSAVLDVIVFRRWLYFLLLAVTFLLVTSRVYLDWVADGVCVGKACVLDMPIRLLMHSLPDFTHGWFEALRQNPAALFGFVCAFAVLLGLSIYLRHRTRRLASKAWSGLRVQSTLIENQAVASGVTDDQCAGKMSKFWNDRVEPVLGIVSAVTVFVIIIYLLLATANGLLFNLRVVLDDGKGSICVGSGNPVEPESPIEISFPVSDGCHASSIKLVAGEQYRIYVPYSGFKDGSYDADPDGIHDPGIMMYLAIPLRRHISMPWMRLFGKVGVGGNEKFSLGVGTFTYTAKTSGELFLYVNDAVRGYASDWDYYYNKAKQGKNTGEIRLIVEKLPLVRETQAL